MALADALAQPTPRTHQRCAVAIAADKLDASDRKVFAAALANPAKTSRDIVGNMTDHGHALTLAPVMRHRRGDCTCGTR